MPRHVYDRGYKAGVYDAATEQPMKQGHGVWAMGYRDGYLDGRKALERGR